MNGGGAVCGPVTPGPRKAGTQHLPAAGAGACRGWGRHTTKKKSPSRKASLRPPETWAELSAHPRRQSYFKINGAAGGSTAEVSAPCLFKKTGAGTVGEEAHLISARNPEPQLRNLKITDKGGSVIPFLKVKSTFFEFLKEAPFRDTQS